MFKKSICAILHKVGPYHHARFLAIAKLFNLTVVEIRSDSSEYAWSSINQSESQYALKHIKSLKDFTLFLRQHSFDAYFTYGWSEIEYLFAISYAKKMGKPIVMGSDSIVISQKWNILKHGFKAIIAQNISGFFVAGTLSEKYIRFYNPKANIAQKFDVVDNTHFNRNGNNDEEKSFLCVARLIKKKNIVSLVDAVALLRNEFTSKGFCLKIVGSGSLESDLNSQIERNNLTDVVKIDPWKSYNELPSIYNQSICLIIPSLYDETWGLVVNEAMAAGLPILASNKCGCVPDLLEDGKTGYIFDPTVTGIRDSLKTFIENHDKHSFGVYCKEIIKDYTPSNHAIELRQLLHLIESKGKRPILFYSLTFNIIVLFLLFKKYVNGDK